jgi:hypothetical protein
MARADGGVDHGLPPGCVSHGGSGIQRGRVPVRLGRLLGGLVGLRRIVDELSDALESLLDFDQESGYATQLLGDDVLELEAAVELIHFRPQPIAHLVRRSAILLRGAHELVDYPERAVQTVEHLHGGDLGGRRNLVELRVRVAEPLDGVLLNGFARDTDSAERHRRIAVDGEEEIGELRDISASLPSAASTAS